MGGDTLRLGSRGSKLALWQAAHVAALLRSARPQVPVELVPMSTQGDRVLDRALADVGGKGLFVKELEVAMQEGRADIAVHSMKDVPSELPPGFAIVAALPRALHPVLVGGGEVVAVLPGGIEFDEAHGFGRFAGRQNDGGAVAQQI